MFPIEIANERTLSRAQWDGFTICRVSRSSDLGNPYKMAGGFSRRSREDVIGQFAVWFDRQLALRRKPASVVYFEELVELARYGPIVLVCWCHPLACHASVIRAKIIERLTTEPQGE